MIENGGVHALYWVLFQAFHMIVQACALHEYPCGFIYMMINKLFWWSAEHLKCVVFVYLSTFHLGFTFQPIRSEQLDAHVELPDDIRQLTQNLKTSNTANDKSLSHFYYILNLVQYT